MDSCGFVTFVVEEENEGNHEWHESARMRPRALRVVRSGDKSEFRTTKQTKNTKEMTNHRDTECTEVRVRIPHEGVFGFVLIRDIRG